MFYLNVPIGIFGSIWAHHRLKEIAKLEKGARIDWPGFITFSISIITFLLALTYEAYGLSEKGTVYVFFLISAVSLRNVCGIREKASLSLTGLRVV